MHGDPELDYERREIIWNSERFPVSSEVADRIENAHSESWKKALMYFVIMQELATTI